MASEIVYTLSGIVTFIMPMARDLSLVAGKLVSLIFYHYRLFCRMKERARVYVISKKEVCAVRARMRVFASRIWRSKNIVTLDLAFKSVCIVHVYQRPSHSIILDHCARKLVCAQ